ncbi:MAG: AzlC family ABC transporter permease [Acidimicrobiales bacterium]
MVRQDEIISEVAADPPLPGRSDLLTIALTFLALGITTQVILLDTGISLTRAWVASAVIYSATSQFAYLAVVQAGGSEVAAIVAGWIVASRFGILAVAISRVFREGVGVRAVAAVHAFDINVGLGLQQVDQARAKKAFWAATLAMMVGWFVGIAAGTFLGDAMGDTERFGIDALFPAALLAIVGNALRTRNGMVAGVTGALICAVLIPITPAGLPIILSVFGVAVAILWERRRSS